MAGAPAYDEMSAAELAAVLGTAEEPFLLDVREPDEVAAGVIGDACVIPLGELQLRVGELPHDRPVLVYCHSGRRSALAASFLTARGLRAANLTGGIVAWEELAAGEDSSPS